MRFAPSAALLFFIALSSAAVAGEKADAIYCGGPILTMDDRRPNAEAVAVKGVKILAVGAADDVLRAHKGKRPQLNDLAGHTMIPGLVDAHGHVFGVGLQSISANPASLPTW